MDHAVSLTASFLSIVELYLGLYIQNPRTTSFISSSSCDPLVTMSCNEQMCTMSGTKILQRLEAFHWAH